jgi:hypothetical protein
MDNIIEWVPIWRQPPPEGRDVAVKVALLNGEYRHDIGKHFPTGGWALQSFEHGRVVAWCKLPRD